MGDLKSIYDRALAACAPGALVRRVVRDDFPKTVVSIGKCAGALLDGYGTFDDAFVAIPAGYPKPESAARVYEGGHPQMTTASLIAGRALLDFVAAHDEITFLISGGGSACVEWPLAPFTEHEVLALNAQLIRSGKSIHEINEERKRVSAIKGGKLIASLRRSVTLVYSDVSSGALGDVASGPTVSVEGRRPRRPGRGGPRPSTELYLIADNETLTTAAADIAQQYGYTVVRWSGQIESDVETAAVVLARAAAKLNEREVIVAGGEPTVEQRGTGQGGRCSELAVRFALHCDRRIDALFGSSDGVDGNSGAAGVEIATPAAIDRDFVARELAQSNSMAIVNRVGRAIPGRPTGNNLRDLYLLACS